MESVIPLVKTIRNTISRTSILSMAAKNKQRQASRPSSDLAQFRSLLSSSRHLVILTGAGVSAESGVPTFRGAGGFWRRYQAQDLASPHHRVASTVWAAAFAVPEMLCVSGEVTWDM